MKQCFVHLGCAPISRIIMTSNNSMNLFCHLWCPKPISYSWKLIPSLYPNQRLRHIKHVVYPLGYIWLYYVWLLFEIIFHQLDLVENIFTLCPHVFCYNIGWLLGLHAVCKFDCIQACIQNECFIYHYYVISKKPQSSTISFTIFIW